MSRLVLIVEPATTFALRLVELLTEGGWLPVSHLSFADARADLASRSPAAVITSLKLGPYNGIQLVYLAKAGNPAVTCVVYGDADPVFGRDAQQAGAFYERRAFLPFAITAYLQGPLPDADRRDVRRADRRLTFRGGRRATDIDMLHVIPDPVVAPTTAPAR